jgi:predicted nucleic-acid-binding Zn-ribbon protein
MKNEQDDKTPCPKCAGKKFAVSRLMKMGRDMGENVLTPLAPVAVVVSHEGGDLRVMGKTLLQFAGFERVKYVGALDLWICLGCGYSEMYAAGLAQIEELAKRCPDQLTIVDATSKQGPHG